MHRMPPPNIVHKIRQWWPTELIRGRVWVMIGEDLGVTGLDILDGRVRFTTGDFATIFPL
jgi:hypothetical protein